MKDILITILIAALAAMCFSSCDEDTEEYYWCEFHYEYHCIHYKCDKVKYCPEHKAYFALEHWKRQQHHV